MHSANHREPHIRAVHQHSVSGIAGNTFRRTVDRAAMRARFGETWFMGFGDVTATLLMGLAVGMFGLFAVVFWWLAIGVVGMLWLVLWTRFDPQKHTAYAGKTPFAPALVAAGAIGIAIGVLF